ncbi:CBS domain-containing protein [Streptomyces sp. GXMU-J15]|uniref:CBS domain-containing protein n=1 Tax=Streptomyces fuscus TaxID=3048495 RepID=A0ABT7IS43_9ACTN|nr:MULTISPECIES: CBS domain-containing protein [Streptomyces]MDL2074909.1 CBS domain-containing protein [Streptomyces fuscus]SBT89634.1 BON domain-containing protein [Streptomyces sp. DI166]
MDGSPSIVSDVMTRKVVAVRRGAAFKDIVKAMRRWRVSGVPVVDDRQRVLGVVSERDLLLKEEFHGGDPLRSRPAGLAKAEARTAGELMTAPAVTADPCDSLARTARTMARYGVHRLPVVDEDGVLQGIVSRSDLLKVFLRDDASIAREVRTDVVALLFPETPEEVRVDVESGVVRLSGRVRNTELVPVAVRMARAVEGVVAVDCRLLGPRHRPAQEPDLADDRTARDRQAP